MLAGGPGSRLGGEGKATVELARRPLLAEVADPELFFNVNSYDDLRVAAVELRRRRRRNPG